MNALSHLMKLAKPHGIEVVDRGNGHIQLKGKLLVNYWPDSKNRTAYIGGTSNGFKQVTPERAIQMALNPPPRLRTKVRRTSSQTSAKRRMLKKDNHCHWCGSVLTIETATVDHVIPLKRGGLNNTNNKVLACKPCNKARADEMPELKK